MLAVDEQEPVHPPSMFKVPHRSENHRTSMQGVFADIGTKVSAQQAAQRMVPVHLPVAVLFDV
jgi:hypothetical protein